MNLTALVGYLLVLLAAGAKSPGVALPEGVFPEGTRIIFQARVLSAQPSAWKPDGASRESRTVAVSLEIVKVLADATGELPGPGHVACEVVQYQWQSEAVWKTPGFWSHQDIHAGLDLIVYGQGRSPVGFASEFAEPLAVVDIARDPTLPSQIELIIQGGRLRIDEQASRLVSALGPGGRPLGTALARYLANLALRSAGRAREQLLDRIATLAGGRASEEGVEELLAALQTGVAMQERPAQDVMRAFEAACLRLLAMPDSTVGADVSPTLESICESYIPWLARHDPELLQTAGSLISREERRRAADKTAKLAERRQFPEKTRQLLHQLADTLR